MKHFDEVSSWYQIELDTRGSLDVVTLKVETNPNFPLDSIGAVEGLQGKIQSALKTALSVGIKVKLVEPKSIPRSEGKAKRVIDLRKGIN
jgi:phenylacetate-CoA ligase